ncbi:hypothetical protein LINPERHAP1_LOCUS2809, partial [Linum perenne]
MRFTQMSLNKRADRLALEWMFVVDYLHVHCKMLNRLINITFSKK